MVVVVALMLVTVVQVTSRYLFKHPFEGVVDASSMMVVTLVFLAGPYNFLVDRHIRVDTVLRRFTRSGRVFVELVMDLVCLAVVGLACWSTIKQGYAMAGTGQVTRTAHIPYYPFFYVVAFGWCLSALAVLGHMAGLLVSFREGRR
ncbi:MAG: TRAP transporter small permease [Anaerolineae bacterium]